MSLHMGPTPCFKEFASRLWIVSLTVHAKKYWQFTSFKNSLPFPIQNNGFANNQVHKLPRKQIFEHIDQCSSVLETHRNSKIWIIGKEKFRNCCRIVGYRIDLLPSIGIDMQQFNRKQGTGQSCQRRVKWHRRWHPWCCWFHSFRERWCSFCSYQNTRKIKLAVLWWPSDGNSTPGKCAMLHQFSQPQACDPKVSCTFLWHTVCMSKFVIYFA